MKISEAIEILESARQKGLPSEELVAISTALECMRSIEKAPIKWFHLDYKGEICAQTTPKGHGRKALCRVVLISEDPELCPCCGLPKVRD